MTMDVLDEIAEDIIPGFSQGEADRTALAAGPRQPIQKINYSHKGMIDLIIANRGITQNELARHFGYSASWISTVMSSDAFQAALAERSAEIEDPMLRATVEQGMKGLVARSMEILRAKLDAEPSAVPDNLALRTLELGSRALGMGAREPGGPQINVSVHLDSLANRLTGLLAQKKIESLPQLLESQQ